MKQQKHNPLWRDLLHILIQNDEDLERLHNGRLTRIEDKIANFIEENILKKGD